MDHQPPQLRPQPPDQALVALAALDVLPGLAVLVLDADLRVVLARGGTVLGGGAQTPAPEGRPLDEVLDDPLALEHCRRALAGEASQFGIDGPDGRLVVEVRPFGEVAGRASALVVIRDVRMSAVPRRAPSADLREAQHRLTHVLAYSADADSVLDDVLHALGEPLGLHVAAWWAADGDRLRRRATWRHRAAMPAALVGPEPDELGAGEGLPGQALATGAVARLPDDAPGTAVAIPVHREGALVGVLEASSPWEGVPDEPTIVFLGDAAHQLDELLSRADARAEVARGEARLRAIMATLGEGLIVTDPDGRAVLSNPAARQILGLDMDELHGRSVYEVGLRAYHEDGSCFAAAEHPIERTRRTGEPFDEVLQGVHRKDGSLRWLAITTRALDGGSGVVCSFSDVTEQRALEARLRDAADHDPLTGLVNRRRFGEELAGRLARLRRHGGHLALILLDLDRFKTVNDTMGHQAGDAVLRAVATAMDGRLRAEDVLARLGGDEFAVLLDGLDRAGGRAVAVELCERVREAAARVAPEAGVSASAGTAAASGSDRSIPSADDLLAAADGAMYALKAAGRDGRLLR